MKLLREAGMTAGGILTREVRVGGRRIGFDIVDVGERGTVPLARESSEPGPRVGRYRVFVENLDGFASRVVEEAVNCCQVLIVDEIGPMELLSSRFRDVLRGVFKHAKRAIITIHYFSRDPLVIEAKKAVNRLYEIRRGEAERVAQEIASLLQRGGR